MSTILLLSASSRPGISFHEDLTNLTEKEVVVSRPLSTSERAWLTARATSDSGDAFPLITLDCSPSTPITDDDVILAWAVLRIRHPMLASRIALAGSTPEIVCTPAPTRAQAIARAKAHVDFSTFVDRACRLESLRAQWEGPRPTRVFDVHREMRVVWQRDAAGSLGHYIFGMQTSHHQLDGRRRLDVMRQFVELLAAPWVALAELDTYFALASKPAPWIPMSIEQRFPQLTLAHADEAEQRLGAEAYDEWMQDSAVPSCGLAVPSDGLVDTEDTFIHSTRHIFSRSVTANILRLCKAQNVTLTQLFQAVWVAAALEVGSEHFGADEARSGLPSHAGAHRFDFVLPLDLMQHAKAQRTAVPPSRDVSLQIAWYPTRITVPRTLATRDRAAVIWAAARQAKAGYAAVAQSPYFWHIVARLGAALEQRFGDASQEAPRPYMPIVSSLGDLAAILPARVSAPALRGGAAVDCGSSRAKDIRITDHLILVKVGVTTPLSHVWTFDGEMVLQFIHSSRSLRPALADEYFGRVVDILMQLGKLRG